MPDDSLEFELIRYSKRTVRVGLIGRGHLWIFPIDADRSDRRVLMKTVSTGSNVRTKAKASVFEDEALALASREALELGLVDS